MSSEGPVSLSRLSRDHDVDVAPRKRWPRWATWLIAVAALALATLLALRWLDDTRARDTVQVLQPLPQTDASKSATAAAATYPFSTNNVTNGHENNGAALSGGMRATTPATPPKAQPASRRAPPGLTSAQWQAQVAALSAQPDGATKIARLESYLVFNDEVRQFRQLHDNSTGLPSPSLVALARQIDTALDTHVKQRMLGSRDAYDIKGALLDVLEPDPDRADDALERWADAIAVMLASDTDRSAVARNNEFERRRQALVSAWTALPPERRDPQALERDIARLRQDVLGTR